MNSSDQSITASFCTRCGLQVEPYTTRGFRQEFPGDELVPLEVSDPRPDGPGVYRCDRCEVRWRACSIMDTGSILSCGHFMPVDVRYCGLCGELA